jgi:hypothetical protein
MEIAIGIAFLTLFLGALILFVGVAGFVVWADVKRLTNNPNGLEK